VRWLALLCLAAALLLPLESGAQATRRGSVWRYELNGVIHYSASEPPAAAKAKQLVFSYVETSPGQTWILVSYDDAAETLVHSSSLTKSGDYASGWVMSSRNVPKDTAHGKATSSKERWTVNCKTKRYSLTDSVLYAGPFGTGEVVYSWSGAMVESSIVPETVGESIGNRICAGPVRGADSPPANGQ